MFVNRLLARMPELISCSLMGSSSTFPLREDILDVEIEGPIPVCLEMVLIV